MKFNLQCNSCGNVVGSLKEWFNGGQRCAECGSDQTDVVYNKDISNVKKLLLDKHPSKKGLWRYFDFLPVNDKNNIVTCGEGDVAIDRWCFLEEFGKNKYGVNCKVYAHRQDNNNATGTFKDLAGSLVASVLKENSVESYIVTTTGNIGVAYARYLSDADITLYAFIPQNSSEAQEAEIGCFGQKVFRVKGDYTRAKELAMEFSQKSNIMLAAGSFDPIRIEAKKIMAYEWIRLIPQFPTVYIQALSGGTGPLGIAKACKELSGLALFEKMPRLVLVQSNKCAPMAEAWAEAKAKNFPENWEKSYPVYHDPETSIPTLATGYPTAYPILSKLVFESGGEITSLQEQETVNVARLIAYESAVRIGPAAAIAVGGFFTSLRNGYIREGDVILLNVGEGIRRSPEFMKELIYTTSNVRTVDECHTIDRNMYRKKLWQSVEAL